MVNNTSDSLQRIIRGTGIAAIGTIIGVLLQFATRILIARYGMEANYGVFSLAVAILNIMAVIGGLGMQMGALRYIAYFHSRGDEYKLSKSVVMTLQITSVSGIVVFALFFSLSTLIAQNIFHSNDLDFPLKIAAMGIPVLVLINVITAIYRGLGDVKPYVFFQICLFNVLFFLLLFYIVFVNAPVTFVYYSYFCALLITLLVAISYFVRNRPSKVNLFTKPDKSLLKEILNFSLPLMGMAILHVSILYINTIMLGFFRPMDDVGLFNSALPLANMLIVPLDAITPIYLPVITGLYANNQMLELRENYRVVTKWLFALIFPVFIILFLFPEAILGIVFGSNYAGATDVLRILSAGFMVSTLLSLSGVNIIAFGSSRYMMWAFILATIVNLTACMLLIPAFGTVGSAIAAVLSLVLLNILYLIKSYKLSGAQPLSLSLLKPVIVGTTLALLFKIAFSLTGLPVNTGAMVLVLIVYVALYLIGILLVHSFDRRDLALFYEIERISGGNLQLVRTLLERIIK